MLAHYSYRPAVFVFMFRRFIFTGSKVVTSSTIGRGSKVVAKRYNHNQIQTPTGRVLRWITRGAQIATIILLFSTLFKKKKPKVTTEYTGEKNEKGQKHGRGILKYSDGSSYDGEWMNGEMHGQGTFRFKNGDVYTGNFEYNNPHGRGLMMYANENIYDGEWNHGKRTGDGTLTFANGSIYIGNWKDGVPVDAPDNAQSEIVLINEGATAAPVEPEIQSDFQTNNDFVSDFGEGKAPEDHHPDSAYNYSSSEDRKD